MKPPRYTLVGLSEFIESDGRDINDVAKASRVKRSIIRKLSNGDAAVMRSTAVKIIAALGHPQGVKMKEINSGRSVRNVAANIIAMRRKLELAMHRHTDGRVSRMDDARLEGEFEQVAVVPASAVTKSRPSREYDVFEHMYSTPFAQ